MTYADECLERANKAMEGPWEVRANTHSVHQPKFECWVPQDMDDAIFIAHSRQDVPELARRLKRACEALREERTFSDVADELEAPLGDE